jgi:CRP-like cAMP-binding protein
MQKFFDLLHACGQINHEAHHAFLEKSFNIQLKEREILLSPGQQQHALYFIDDGIVRHFYQAIDRKEWTSQLNIEGDLVLSIESFLFNQPSEKFIETYTQVSLTKIDKSDFQDLLIRFPELNNAFNRVIQLKLLVDEQRLYHSYTLNVCEQYKKFTQTYPTLVSRVQVQHLASYLGMNADTLSRIRKELSRTR